MKLALVGLFAVAASNLAPGCSPAEILEWWAQHGGHHPPARCERIPSDFYVEGCGFRTVCHAEQDGCDWQAVCNRGELMLNGSGALSTIGFGTEAGYACVGRVDDGQVRGSCSPPASDGGAADGGAPVTCEFATRDPMPIPSCIEVPSRLAFGGCGVDATCTVAQHGCEWLATCGDQVFGGTASDTGISWTDANRYRCSGTLENGSLNGSCQPPATTSDAGTTADAGATADAASGPPACTFGARPPPGTPPAPTCVELPASFVFEGCEQEVPCQIDQRGCIWQASCGATVFGGRAGGQDFTWVDDKERSCSARSVSGSFAGVCRGPYGHRCAFEDRDPVPGTGCLNVPARLTVQGCGWDTNCSVIQDGCVWQASCNDGDISFAGTTDAQSLAWNVGNRYPCTAASSAGGFNGTCQNGSQQCAVTIAPAP